MEMLPRVNPISYENRLSIAKADARKSKY